jgi:putative ABC transport system substrate-binding protein
MLSDRQTGTFEEGGKAPSGIRRQFRRVAAASAVAASLIACHTPVAAKDRPIEIGVLAFGPRYIPDWRCGQADFRPGSATPRQETMPYYVVGLLDQLNKLKYVEDKPEHAGKAGRRFVLNLRTGTAEQLHAAAREFAAKPVDVIVAVATAAVSIAQQQTRDRPIPILTTGVSDHVQYGFVQSLARPGGMITGVSHQVVQGSAKRVELFKEMLPGLKRMITIRAPDYVPSEQSMEEIKLAADRLGIQVLDWTVKNRGELQNTMAKVRNDTADGMMVLADSLVIANLDLVIETSLAQKKPLFGLMDYMSHWGAIGSSGPSAYQAGSRVAWYLDKIVKGAKPGDLPIEPVDPEFVVNLKAAACHGVTVPLGALSQADRVIR